MHTFLAPVFAKIERAKKHSADLTTSIASWAATNPIQARCELRDGRMGYRLVQLDYSTPPPLTDWGLMLGDYAHNLRSALDNLAFALARLQHDPPDRPATISFPIYFDASKFRQYGKRSIDRLPSQAAAVVERIQPYQQDGGNKEGTPEQDPLLFLQELNNADKHRVPSVLLVAPDNLSHEHEIEFRSDGEAQQNVPLDVTAWAGPLAPGTVLYEMRTKHPLATVKGRTEIRAVVAVEVLSKPFPIEFLVTAVGTYTSLVIEQLCSFFPESSGG